MVLTFLYQNDFINTVRFSRGMNNGSNVDKDINNKGLRGI